MDAISELVYNEMLKKEYWERAYERLANKPQIDTFVRDTLYYVKEGNEYKDLALQVCNGTYAWSTPEKLLLSKVGTTKKRVVYMYSMQDRFVLGVLYRALNTLFDDRVSVNCFSYKRGVNTSAAIKHIDKIKSGQSMFGVKLDISAYFNSIDRGHLNNCLTELFGKDSTIRKSMDVLFNNDIITYKGTELSEYKAMIPGCALGSFFANYCLREIDFYFDEKKVVYARYSDDIILLDTTREKVDSHLRYIKNMLAKYGLSINEKKYVYFEPNEPIEYLGLSLSDRGIDISENAKNKLKRTIKRWIKDARKTIEMEDEPFDKVAKKLIKRLNWKLYKSYVKDASKFGWAFYAFRYITVLDSLTEIDYYLRDRLRYLKTGKNNKANAKALKDEDFRDLGVLSLYDMYKLFHEDFSYYYEIASII